MMYKKILCAAMIVSISQPMLGFTQIYNAISNLFSTTAADDSFLVRHEFDPNVTFNNVIGLHEIQERFQVILALLENPELFEKAGVSEPRCYILEGPARCGKTFISVALAGEIRNLFIKQNRHPREFNCYQIHAREIIQEMSASRLVAALKRNTPCILLIDEIDLLLRSSDKKSEEFSLLVSLYTYTTPEQIFIIGATNHFDYLPKMGKFGPHVIHFKSFNPYSINPYQSS